MKERIRISLTLRPEVVSLLDSKIDGSKIRNRSHAVEHYLKQALLTPIQQAIIVIKDQNNPLAIIGNETAIEKTFKQLGKALISNIILVCPPECGKLKKFLSKKKFAQLNISYVKHRGKGSAEAILACAEILSPGPFLVTYGDIIAEIDICDMGDFHKTINTIITSAITSITDPSPWGIVKVKRNHIVEFQETTENLTECKLSNLINAGIYVLQPEIFGYINKKIVSLEEEVFPVLIKQKQLSAYLLDGLWYNLSRKDLLEKAKKHYKKQ